MKWDSMYNVLHAESGTFPIRDLCSLLTCFHWKKQQECLFQKLRFKWVRGSSHVSVQCSLNITRCLSFGDRLPCSSCLCYLRTTEWRLLWSHEFTLFCAGPMYGPWHCLLLLFPLGVWLDPFDLNSCWKVGWSLLSLLCPLCLSPFTLFMVLVLLLAALTPGGCSWFPQTPFSCPPPLPPLLLSD